ncbi:MAG: hypothetical protein IT305_22500 [Chloroflexi bacterium]|nr:hypothetical protein [Chloroflexota bacterium]
MDPRRAIRSLTLALLVALSLSTSIVQAGQAVASPPPPPVMLNYPRVAAIDGKVYLVGVIQGASDTRLSRYDPTANTWTALTSMPEYREKFALAASGGKLYVLGGNKRESGSLVEFGVRTPWEYDPATDAWRSGADAPATLPEGGSATTAPGGTIYITGGIFGPTGIQTYDPSADTWGSGVTMPVARVFPELAAAPNGKLYVVGGAWGITFVMPVAEYDPPTAQWATGAVMPNARTGIGGYGVTYLDGKIYAFGGDTANVVDVYDPQQDTWTTMAGMPTRWAMLAATAVNHLIYVVGQPAGTNALSVEVYDPASNTWLVESTPPTLAEVRLNNGAFDTTSPNVTASVSASDVGTGLYDMSLSNDGATWSAWRAFASSTAWTLAPGDGPKRVFVRVRDKAGLISEVRQAAISLNGAVGSSFGVSVNQGALFTNRVDVALGIGAAANTAEMQVSNDGGFAGVTWEPYAASKAWQITRLGTYVLPRVVYVRFRDVNGAVSAAFQDDIILDETPPTGSVVLGSGSPDERKTAPDGHKPPADEHRPPADEHRPPNDGRRTPDDGHSMPDEHGPVRASSVTLALSARDDVSGVADMRVSVRPDLAGAGWEPFAGSRRWDRGGTAFVQFRDNAGNVSPTYSTTTNEPEAPSCAPRPAPSVVAVPAGDGRLQVTVTANPDAVSLLAVQFGAVTNGRVDVLGGLQDLPSHARLELPSGTHQTTFFVRRTAPGAAVHVPFTVVDGCGPWPTFVGGGAGAF